MDFIERIFHLAPDGGNGLTELAVVLVCALTALAAYRLHRERRRQAFPGRRISVAKTL